MAGLSTGHMDPFRSVDLSTVEGQADQHGTPENIHYLPFPHGTEDPAAILLRDVIESRGCWTGIDQVYIVEVLLRSIRAGNLDLMNWVLCGARISGINLADQPDGEKGLIHEVAWTGRVDMCEALLDAGARVRAKDQFWEEPIHWAVRGGHQEMLRFLVDKGADLEATGWLYRTPLHFAASLGDCDIACFLLERGANHLARDLIGNTPLDLAKENDEYEVHELILMAERVRLGRAQHPERAADPIYQRDEPKEAYPKLFPLGTYEQVTRKLQDVMDSMDTWSGLEQDLLLQALRQFIQEENVVETEWLLRSCLSSGKFLADKPDGKEGLIHVVTRTEHVQLCQMLIKGGARVRAKDEWGDEPIHCAVEGRHQEMVQCLLDNGADLEAKGDNGWTSLHVAAMLGDYDLAHFLLEQGADYLASDIKGRTPYDLAREEYDDVAKLFLEWHVRQRRAQHAAIESEEDPLLSPSGDASSSYNCIDIGGPWYERRFRLRRESWWTAVLWVCRWLISWLAGWVSTKVKEWWRSRWTRKFWKDLAVEVGVDSIGAFVGYVIGELMGDKTWATMVVGVVVVRIVKGVIQRCFCWSDESPSTGGRPLPGVDLHQP